MISGGTGLAIYGMWIRTGRLLPTGVQGEFSLVEMKLLTSALDTCTLGIIGTYDSVSYPEVSFTITTSDYQVGLKPYGAARIQQCELQFIERATAGSVNQAVYFEGLALEIKSRNKLKELSSGKVL
jgi:hypothetical protein